MIFDSFIFISWWGILYLALIIVLILTVVMFFVNKNGVFRAK